RRHRPSSTSRGRSLQALNRLESLLPALTSRPDRFAFLLSGIVRRFLQRRFELTALSQTTSEFQQSLVAETRLTGADKAWLTALLQRCDLVKFAGLPLSSDEYRPLMAEVRRFIERCVAEKSD